MFSLSYSQHVLVSLGLALLGSAVPTLGAEPAKTDGKVVPDKQAFLRDGAPFLKQFCYECHGNQKQKGDLNFETITLDIDTPEVGELWTDIYTQVQFSEMPPDKATEQPTAADKAKFLIWLESQLSKYGQGFGLDEKLLLPEYANYLDHKTLFDGSVKDEPYTPARLWRQRPSIYHAFWATHYGKTPKLSVKIGTAGRMNARNLVQRGPHKGKIITTRYFNNAKFANPFYEFVHHASGFTDYATIRADQASLEALLTNSETMAEILTEGLKVKVGTEVKNKDSRHGNNHGGFVGGVETNTIERRGRIPAIFHKIVNSDGPVYRKDFDEALGIAFALFLRRAPDQEESDHYWEDVFQRNLPLGNKMALQSVLIYLTLTPEFVYRMEIGMGAPDRHGRRMLSPQELVYTLQYALNNTPPFGVDDFETVDVYTKKSEPAIRDILTKGNPGYPKDTWLVEQMKEGKLKTREDVEVAVRHLLNARARTMVLNHNAPIGTVTNPRILQFFREFFGYHKAPTVFKDTDKFAKIDGFKQFTNGSANRLAYDTDTLILHILAEDKNVLYELLTTNKVYSAYGTNHNPDNVRRAGGKEKYAEKHVLQSYNLDPFNAPVAPGSDKKSGRNKTPALLAPKEQRCGILTQPSWLIAHSGNFDNDPVLRGKWIREKLLAGSVLDVPINVDAQVPDDEHKTLRERFEVVHAEQCWRCHTKMNPLGMPFEAYNHVGRHRTTEVGKPVDTTGAISHTGIKGLDGEVANVREMMERIAKSDLARQSFVRHVFRYWMGRNELLSDSKSLIAMDKAYVESGGSFKELLVALFTSDSFLYRK